MSQDSIVTDGIISFNPSTGEELDRVKSFNEEEAQIALTKAEVAQKAWEENGIDERIKVLRRFQGLLMDEMDDFCKLISLENGKPAQEALETEVLPIIDLSNYFTKRAKKILADQKIPLHLMKHRKSFLHYRPRGVVLVISPWNFPFAIPTGTVIMSLLAGNAVVHKPASLTPLIALKTKELFERAGLDPDLYQVLPSAGYIGSRMIEMGVDYVNFTGSTGVGLQVAATCGSKLTPCSMELGGKDPLIVCKDADLDSAVGSIVWGGLANAGQICASVERVYAHKDVYNQVVERVVDKVKTLRVGDPSTGEVDMGPMVDINQLEIIDRQIKDAVSKGAHVLTGGNRIEGKGQFFEPTVIVDVNDTMDIINEENFGPVIPIFSVENDEEAIRLANDSEYGLSAYVFTSDADKGRKIAKRLEAGTVMVNDVLITHGAPETPWQGVKESGMGKVHSDQGLRDLCQAYHVNEESFALPFENPFWQPYSEAMYNRLKSTVKILYRESISDKLKGLTNLFKS